MSRDPSAPVDEAVDAMLEDALHLLLHLLLLGRLDLSYFSGGVHTHPGAEDLRTHTLALAYSASHGCARAQTPPYLDLVRVHAGVGDQDVGVLDPLGLVDADPLVQQEACEEQEEPAFTHRHTCVR